jgi:ferrous-iron efflux pump FieF
MAANRPIVERAAQTALAVTIGVVLVKAAGAWASGSVALLGEAVQSVLDVALAMATLMSVRYASRPPDAGHPYGHGKAELVGNALQTTVSLVSALFIAYRAVERLLRPEPIHAGWALLALAVSSAATLGLWLHLRRVHRETGSDAIAGEVRHQAGDLAAGGGLLAGVGLAGATGVGAFDPLTAAVFAAVSGTLAVRQLRSVGARLLDPSLSEPCLRRIEEVLGRHPAVRGFHDLRTRDAGGVKVVEMHVMLDDDLPFVRAHAIAEEVEGQVSEALGGAMVTVHYEPFEAETAHRASEHA